MSGLNTPGTGRLPRAAKDKALKNKVWNQDRSLEDVTVEGTPSTSQHPKKDNLSSQHPKKSNVAQKKSSTSTRAVTSTQAKPKSDKSSSKGGQRKVTSAPSSSKPTSSQCVPNNTVETVETSKKPIEYTPANLDADSDLENDQIEEPPSSLDKDSKMLKILAKGQEGDAGDQEDDLLEEFTPVARDIEGIDSDSDSEEDDKSPKKGRGRKLELDDVFMQGPDDEDDVGDVEDGLGDRDQGDRDRGGDGGNDQFLSAPLHDDSDDEEADERPRKRLRKRVAVGPQTPQRPALPSRSSHSKPNTPQTRGFAHHPLQTPRQTRRSPSLQPQPPQTVPQPTPAQRGRLQTPHTPTSRKPTPAGWHRRLPSTQPQQARGGDYSPSARSLFPSPPEHTPIRPQRPRTPAPGTGREPTPAQRQPHRSPLATPLPPTQSVPPSTLSLTHLPRGQDNRRPPSRTAETPVRRSAATATTKKTPSRPNSQSQPRPPPSRGQPHPTPSRNQSCPPSRPAPRHATPIQPDERLPLETEELNDRRRRCSTTTALTSRPALTKATPSPHDKHAESVDEQRLRRSTTTATTSRSGSTDATPSRHDEREAVNERPLRRSTRTATVSQHNEHKEDAAKRPLRRSTTTTATSRPLSTHTTPSQPNKHTESVDERRSTTTATTSRPASTHAPFQLDKRMEKVDERHFPRSTPTATPSRPGHAAITSTARSHSRSRATTTSKGKQRATDDDDYEMEEDDNNSDAGRDDGGMGEVDEEGNEVMEPNGNADRAPMDENDHGNGQVPGPDDDVEMEDEGAAPFRSKRARQHQEEAPGWQEDFQEEEEDDAPSKSRGKKRPREHDETHWDVTTRVRGTKMRDLHEHLQGVIHGAIETALELMAMVEAWPSYGSRKDYVRELMKAAANDLGPSADTILDRLEEDADFPTYFVAMIMARIPVERSGYKSDADKITAAIFEFNKDTPEDAQKGAGALLKHDNYVFPCLPGRPTKLDLTKPYSQKVIIRLLMKMAFYPKKNSFFTSCPERFEVTYNDTLFYEFPLSMVALAATAFHSALFDWTLDGHPTTMFTGDAYSGTYEGHCYVLRRFLKKKPDEYHTAMINLFDAASELFAQTKKEKKTKPPPVMKTHLLNRLGL